MSGSTSGEVKLTAQLVETTFHWCRGFDVEVEGIIEKTAFRQDRLDEKAELIVALLMELPETFRRSGGGGWTFLNASHDRHGRHWAEQTTMDRLFMLGMAIGKVECLMPREMWPILPGGVPYYQVKD